MYNKTYLRMNVRNCENLNLNPFGTTYFLKRKVSRKPRNWYLHNNCEYLEQLNIEYISLKNDQIFDGRIMRYVPTQWQFY